MPRVNGKEFSYTKSGREAARKEASKTGKEMSSSRNHGQRGMQQRSDTANSNAQGPGARKRDKNLKNKGRK